MKSAGRLVRITAISVALVAAAAIPAAHAASANTTFAVTASVLSACSVTASPLVFGVYSPAAPGNVDNSSTISVFCTVGTTYTLKLNVGTGGGTFATRTLTNGTDPLSYNLFTSAGRTTVWGDGTASTGTVTGTGTGLLSATSHTVHGRLTAGQDVPPGAYQSVVTVTLEYT